MKTLFALLVVVACHTPSPDPTPAPVASSSVAPLATPSTAPTMYPTAPSVDAGATTNAPKTIDDVAAWLGARHANVPAALANGASCTEEELGTNDALLCHSIPESLPTGESIYPITVWIVRSGRADLALTAASGAGPLDREIVPGATSDDMYVEFDVAITGSELAITERPQKTCARVLAEYKSHEMDGHRRVVQKACAARGRYVLHDGKLVRAP